MMNQQAEQSIIEMLNGFQQTGQDYRLFLATLARQCSGLSDLAIIEAADRFGAGDVKDQSKKFAPTIPEFVDEARQRQEFLEIKARPRLEAPKYRPGLVAPFEVERQKSLAKFKDYPIIAENVSYDEWRRLSASRQVPVGAVWSAALATIFGPKASTRQEAA